MGKSKIVDKSFSQLTRKGLAEVRKKLIAEEKRKNGYLIVADKNGRVKKVPAYRLH